MKPNLPLARGFTLIELIITVIVIGIMAAALAPLMASSLRAYDDIRGDVEVLDKLRYATERIAREVREINYSNATTSLGFNFIDPATNATYSASGMGATSMKFNRTFVDEAGTSTADVTIGNTGDSVTLNYSTSVAGTQILTDELGGTSGTPSANLSFSYRDSDGNPTTLVTAVRSVVITLTLRHNSKDYAQKTRVELKNHL